MNGQNVKIVWKQKANPTRDVAAGYETGIFPIHSLMLKLSLNRSSTVNKVAKDFVEEWCGIEGCIDRIVSIEEVE